jgi:serine/threonine protein phosphatase PrpC
MEVLTAVHTDIGTKKPMNQDSLCLKIADTSVGTVVLAVICDGMGGLSKGELASATVIAAFSEWFDRELPSLIANNQLGIIQNEWERMIQEQNVRIGEYGQKIHAQLGTTLTALLMIDSQFLLIGHVGDTRVYRIDDQRIEILTDDQTLVGRELRRGTLTPEQAKVDPRRNVLLQCIGASKVVVPEFRYGKPMSGEVYMLCSDGFRNMITEEEIHRSFLPQTIWDEAAIEQKAIGLVELNKQRQETDNITVMLIKIL